MRSWLIDIKLSDETLPTLKSASIDKALGHQQGGKDGRLCHEVSPDTAPSCPTDVMIALSLLRKSSLYEPTQYRWASSTLKHYKNTSEE